MLMYQIIILTVHLDNNFLKKGKEKEGIIGNFFSYLN